MKTFKDECVFPYDLATVFNFFNTPKNLGKITPGYMNFKLLTPDPIIMKENAVFDYQLHLFGLIPVRWTSLITQYEPPYQFTDIQLKGPHSYWHHQHTFKEVEGGTLVTDTVAYKLPLEPLSTIADYLVLRHINTSMFAHRKKVVDQYLGK